MLLLNSIIREQFSNHTTTSLEIWYTCRDSYSRSKNYYVIILTKTETHGQPEKSQSILTQLGGIFTMEFSPNLQRIHILGANYM